MESFRNLYLEYCKTYNADPQECVKSELKRLSLTSDETSYTFNLSSHHLSEKTCMILSKLLARDTNFTALHLNDCSLSNDGLRDICHAMSTNNSIKFLELKGNNIHGDGTEYLAKMLRQNSTIISLSLEWNSLGLMDRNSFTQFCESLGMNKSLKDLDLRNNQITHTSALELCTAIEVNTALKTLDLRWNNVGLVGGKGILAAMKKNHTITQIQLAGNNIPEEIVDAINVKLAHNNEQVKLAKEYSNRTQTLTNQLQSVQFQKDKQVNLLLSKIDLQEEAVRKTNRAMSDKMKKLQTALEDRMSTMSAMQSKLSIAEGDLALSEQKCQELQHTLQKLQLDKDNEIKLLNAKMKRDKEDMLSDKLKLEREMGDMTLRVNQLEEKLKESERKCQELQLAAYEAKEKLAQGQAEYQIKMVVLDDEARRLKQKHRDELKEFENNKQKDMERLREDYEINEKHLKDRINKLESIKHSNEDEISRLKSTMASEKLIHEQEVHELKMKAQLDDNQRRKELEERMKQLQTSKDDLINENSKMNAKIVDQQQKIASHLLEIETLKRNNDLLRTQINDKENDLMLNTEKVKTDYEKKLRSIQKDIDKCDEYKDKLHDLELKIKKMEAEYNINLKNLQMERDQFKMKSSALEDIIDKYKEEDETRNKKAHAMIKEVFKPSNVLNKQ